MYVNDQQHDILSQLIFGNDNSKTYTAPNERRTNKERDRSVDGHNVHELYDGPHSMPVLEMGMPTQVCKCSKLLTFNLCVDQFLIIPKSDSKGNNDECHKMTQVPQSIRLQRSHPSVQAEIVRHVETEGTSNERHLNKGIDYH